MPDKKILVVDDEKNIRMTISYTLEMDGYAVETAVDGEDALQKMVDTRYDLMLLDLRMPGIDGMDVVRRLAARGSGPRIVIISAHGTVSNAVEAMKLGAIDFIQKPFTPDELRRLVSEILRREDLPAGLERDYETGLQLVKRLASDRKLTEAIELAKETIGIDPARPEAFNLLGALYDIDGDHAAAMKNYRVALDLEPGYRPAQENLQREWRLRSNPNLG